MELTKSQEDKLRHMLGAEPGRYPKKRWGFRNHYAACAGDQKTIKELTEMVNAGLLVGGPPGDRLVFFYATEKGCRAVGLTGSRIKEALRW